MVSVQLTYAQLPDFVFEKKLCGSDAASSDQMGYAVHMYKNHYIVGDPRHDKNDVGATVTDIGAAYIYERSATGTWSEHKISPPDGNSTDLFGSSVSISDSFAVVGATWHDYYMFSSTVYNNIGAAYVYKRNAGTGNWSFYQKLSPHGVGPLEDTYNADDWFGQSVSISGNTIVVGALYHDYDSSNNFVSNAGAAFIFEWDAINMQFEYKQKIFEPTLHRNDDDVFATNLQVEGNIIVVGTPGQEYDVTGLSGFMTNAGAAYIFERNVVDGEWDYAQKITAPYISGFGTLREANANFGLSVAVHNGSIAVGAPFTDLNLFSIGSPINDHGLVFTYFRPASTWVMDGYIQSLSAEADAWFGNAVSIYDNQLVVGSNMHDRGAGVNADLGRVDLYYRDYPGGVWTLTPTAGYSISPTMFGDQFGKSVSTYGNKFLAGALNYDRDATDNFVANIGAAFVFCGPIDFTTQPLDTAVCEGDTAVFSVEVYNAPALQWYESTDGGTTWNLLADNTMYNGVTTNVLSINGVTGPMHLHQYRCVAQGECVPVSVNSFEGVLTVKAKPVIIFSLANNVCINGSGVLLNAVPGGGTYSGATISGGPSFDPATNGLGTYTISYDYTDMINGCSATDTQVITVRNLPLVSFNLTDDEACSNEGVFAIGGASPAGGTYTGSGVSGTSFNPAVSGSGTFFITYTYIDGYGCLNSATDAMHIKPAPTVTLFLADDHVCSTDAAFTLSGGLPAGGVYSGAGISGGIFNPPTAGVGTHTVTYMYADASSGCIDTATQDLTVDNCSGIGEIIAGEQVYLYPNPADEVLNIRLGNLQLEKLVILNAAGQQVLSTNQTTVHTGSLSNGFYQVWIQTDQGNTLHKLVVAH